MSGNESNGICWNGLRLVLGGILLDMEFQDIFLLDGAPWVFSNMAAGDEMLSNGELLA
jgi:hypothetical protein